METPRDPASAGSGLSRLSSLEGDDTPPYVQPHYKESYRLAIYALLRGGRKAYGEFLRAERVGHFLSEQEIRFVLENAEPPAAEDEPEGRRVPDEPGPSSYFPTESEEEVPDLELGWPGVSPEYTDTSISLLFQPPRRDTPTIKEVLRKHIQHARQVVAIAMDVFTDVDIFKEVVGAALRGVVVYVLLDESHFQSFLVMSQRVGVHIPDLKNMRVRTVRGQLYQCQSGMRFHGGLQQKFTLVDCSTVLYGTYSYTWTHEKIHVSMVLVVTGQLLWSFDEEFRRLFARSTPPPARQSASRLSLDQTHRGPGTMTRGLSVQDKLHRSHCPGTAPLVRGHSHGAELQKLHATPRLKMGTRDIGSPSPPQRTPKVPPQVRHLQRYGADHDVIPFNSELSLHRWRMDAYFHENSPTTPPYDWSRMEDARQKRLSLQEYVQLRRSQESLRSVYSTLDRTRYMSSLRSLDTRSAAESEPGAAADAASYREPRQEGSQGPSGPGGYRHDDGKTPRTYQRHEPASELDPRPKDPTLKLSHLQCSSLSLQHPRAMACLTEVPEEKESSHAHAEAHSAARSGPRAEPWHRDQSQRTRGSSAEAANSVGSAALRGANKQNPDPSASEAKSADTEQQRKSSTTGKVQPKKEEKSLHRKTSFTSQSPAQASANGPQNCVSGPADTERHRSPFSRLNSFRSSRRKTDPPAGQDSRSSLDGEGTSDRACSRYEFVLSADAKGSSLRRPDPDRPAQSGADRKLGRFMQRMGNLIGKSK